MSDVGKDAKVASLVAQATQAVQQGNSHAALQQLKEASHLDSENEAVQQALKRLQLDSPGDEVVLLLEQYASAEDSALYQSILERLSRTNTLSRANATRCLDVILEHKYNQESWTEFMVRLLSRQIEARKTVAKRTLSTPEYVFQLCMDADNNASKAIFQILFEAAVWDEEKQQATAQQATFRRCVAQAASLPAGHSSRASELLLRQLILSPATVAESVDEGVFRCLFGLLHLRQQQQVRGQALLATTKLLEAVGDGSENTVVRLLLNYASRSSDVVVAFSAAAALFPVIPATCAKLFLMDGFVQTLVPALSGPRIAEVGSGENTVQTAVLELLSAACVDKACRDSVLKSCRPALQVLCKDDSSTLATMAALILTKILDSNIDSAIISRLVHATLHTSVESALGMEGLAYASLQPKVKEQLISNHSFVVKLVATLRQQHKTVLSNLTIVSNLSMYRPAVSEEQKKIRQLKAYANSSQPTADDPLDNPAMVRERCKKLLDAGVVSALAASSKDFRTSTSLNLVAKILLSLAREPKHRTRMVQEGAIKLLLLAQERLVAVKDTTTAKRFAAHALALILISVNPDHVFNTALPATSAVSAIIPLLEVERDENERDLLPTFEALLALTNLASMSDDTVGTLIIRRGWETLENQLLLSENRLIQRASVELVCNLMLAPTGVAKFADGSDQAGRRLHILLALADVEDLATRRAAGGALAMLTEWDTAVAAILKIPRGAKILLSLCSDSHDEIKHRGVICALNCVGIPGEIGSQAVSKLQAEDGSNIIRGALKDAKTPDVIDAGNELLQKLM